MMNHISPITGRAGRPGTYTGRSGPSHRTSVVHQPTATVVKVTCPHEGTISNTEFPRNPGAVGAYKQQALEAHRAQCLGPE